MGLKEKARAPSPLKVITEIHMSHLETGAENDTFETEFQNFSISGGAEINSQELIRLVVHFQDNELQAIQLDSRPQSPLPHIPSAIKLAVSMRSICYIPSLWKESTNHQDHREKSERHRILGREGIPGII